jgi:hypothetical protein
MDTSNPSPGSDDPGPESPADLPAVHRRASGVGTASLVLAAAAGALMILLIAVRSPEPPAEEQDDARTVDLRAVDPGVQRSLTAAGREFTIAVPAGEGVSYGTMQISIPSLGIDSGPLTRDGSLETAWLADVNGDLLEDVLLVLRSAGSGSSVDLVLLESTADSYTIRSLPPIPAAAATAMGYMGHDAVEVAGGVIRRTFPSYATEGGPRIDRQWDRDDAIAGKSPIKVAGDSNMDPSGSTRRLRLDLTTGRWEES